MKQQASIVITDLDNTLFDWVDIWHKSFKAMLDCLVRESGISEDILIQEFKQVHEKHGTSEYAFSIQELPSLQALYPSEDLAKRFESAIHKYKEAREASLRLYPAVLETLETLKDKGCLLVGYTDSMSFYTSHRMRSLGLDRVFDFLYSPPDHELPAGIIPKNIRSQPEEHYELRRTVHLHLPKGEIKPNPEVLRDIIRGVGGTIDETIYVGDSLMKDVVMAQKAGVTEVWAKYGAADTRVEYELLRKVTHWKEGEVTREKHLRADDIKPRYILTADFSELLNLFEFHRFVEKSNESMARVVEVWKKTVDVQQHFNDIELRIRNFAVTLLAAVIGVASLGIKEKLHVSVLGFNMPLATVIFIMAIFPWLSFYFMDRCWYHRLLLGAVAQGSLIEKRWSRELPELSLTDSIGNHSPFKLFGTITLFGLTLEGRPVRSSERIDLFYLAGVVVLSLMALACSLTTG